MRRLCAGGGAVQVAGVARDNFLAKWVSKRKMKTSYEGPKFEGTWSLDELFFTADPKHRDVLRHGSASDTVVVP